MLTVFLAKATPRGTHCKWTKKDSALLPLRILTESVHLKGGRFVVFSCHLKSSVNAFTDCWVKPVRPDSEATPDSVVPSLTRIFPSQPSFSISFLVLHWRKPLVFGKWRWSEKELGSGVMRGQWEAGGLVVRSAHPWADASKETEGWLWSSQSSAPFRVENKDVERDKNNLFKECPQKSSGLGMAVLCKYFCAWFSRHVWEVCAGSFKQSGIGDFLLQLWKPPCGLATEMLAAGVGALAGRQNREAGNSSRWNVFLHWGAWGSHQGAADGLWCLPYTLLTAKCLVGKASCAGTGRFAELLLQQRTVPLGRELGSLPFEEGQVQCWSRLAWRWAI